MLKLILATQLLDFANSKFLTTFRPPQHVSKCNKRGGNFTLQLKRFKTRFVRGRVQCWCYNRNRLSDGTTDICSAGIQVLLYNVLLKLITEAGYGALATQLR